MRNLTKSALLASVSMAMVTVTAQGAAFAEGAAEEAVKTTSASAATPPASQDVGEVIVTATRRNESAQKVPMTIQAFSGTTLQSLNIATLDDLVKYTPNVAFANNGPGQGAIYMRGLSTGFAGNQNSGNIGNFPNVAIYLDDQSMQFPGRNVDVYMVDMQRVEVLEGPQGTLFGGGAEAGAVRYITNKPKFNVEEGRVEGGYSFTEGGDPNTSLNAMINIPLIQDKLAVRAVVYNERQGGYINNVPSTFTRANSDLGNYYLGIASTGGACPNGKAPGSIGYCTLSTAPQANNYAIAAKAQNPATYSGARLSALYQINADWDVLISTTLSNLDAEGVSAVEPTGADFQALPAMSTTTFSPAYDHDNFQNTAWTLNGKVGDFKVVYTGSYMNRHITQQQDYTNYARAAYGIYYQCTGGNTYWGHGKTPTCYSPVSYWQDKVRNTHLSNEIRFSTPDDWRLRFVGGAFFEQFRIYDVMQWNYKNVPSCTAANIANGVQCAADVAPSPAATLNEGGLREDTVGFGDDIQRGYDQTAVFGSFDYDIIPKVLTVTAGGRFYDYNEFEKGSQFGTNYTCSDVINGTPCGNIVNIDALHDKVTYRGFKGRYNLTWHITPTTLVYATYSEGFRPGAFNRGSGATAKDASGIAQYEKPNGYAPDSLKNNEIGVKSNLFDNRLQLNLSAYFMDWDHVQFVFFNPAVLGNTAFGANGPNYHVKGAEGQFVFKVTDSLTLQGSGTYNDDTQANSPCLIANIPSSPEFGQCITEVKGNAFQNPFGKIGSTPAFSPKFQGNMRLRYDWRFADYKAFAIFGGSYTGSMYNQPVTYTSGQGVLVPNTTLLRYQQPAYTTFDGSVNIGRNGWTVGLFGSNLTNSHASVFTSSAQFIKSEVPLRPRVLGVKISSSF